MRNTRREVEELVTQTKMSKPSLLCHILRARQRRQREEARAACASKVRSRDDERARDMMQGGWESATCRESSTCALGSEAGLGTDRPTIAQPSQPLACVSRLPAESMSIKPTSELPSFVLPKSGCLMRTLAKSCFFNMSRGGSRNTRLRPDYRLNERGIVRSTRQKGGSRAPKIGTLGRGLGPSVRVCGGKNSLHTRPHAIRRHSHGPPRRAGAAGSQW